MFDYYVYSAKNHIKKRGNQLAEARVSTPTNQTSCSTPYLNTAFVNCPLIGCQLRLVEIELQGIAQTLFFYVCQFVFLHDIFVLQCDCKDRVYIFNMQEKSSVS